MFLKEARAVIAVHSISRTDAYDLAIHPLSSALLLDACAGEARASVVAMRAALEVIVHAGADNIIFELGR